MNKPRQARVCFGLTALAGLGFAFSLLAPTACAQQGKQPTQRIVEGNVVDKGGKPLANAVVYIEDTKSMTIKSYLTDDKGHYHFAQLSLTTDYDLWANLNGVHSKTRHISSFNSKPDLEYTIKVETVAVAAAKP